jgi:multisubunit Na+/H+ antiporter MnhB subunit
MAILNKKLFGITGVLLLLVAGFVGAYIELSVYGCCGSSTPDKGIGWIIAVIMIITGVSLCILALKQDKTRPKQPKIKLLKYLAIISTAIVVVLTNSVLLIGPSFFNNPVYTSNGPITNETPYNIEIIFLAIFIVISIFLWYKNYRYNKLTGK